MSTSRRSGGVSRPGAVLGLHAATGLSVAGNAAVAVLVPWLVLGRTGSPATAGAVNAVAFAAAVPALLLAGPLLDRYDRRTLSVVADLLSAAAVVAIALTGTTVGLGIVTLSVLVAFGAAFDGPGRAARESLRPDVAQSSGRMLERVNAEGEIMEQVGIIGGPALAGLGLAAVGVWGSLWGATGLFLAAAATTFLALPSRPRPSAPSESYLASAQAGLRAVRLDPVLRDVGLVGALVMMFVAPLVLVLTTFYESRAQPGALGLTLSGFAVGGIIGALAYGLFATGLRRRTVLLTGMALASVGMMTMGMMTMGAFSSPWALTLVALGIGAVYGPSAPIFAVVIQNRTPPHLRGRVISTITSLALVSTPLATLGAGVLLSATGPATALLVIGVGCLVTAGTAATLPGLRRIESRDLRLPAQHSG